MSCKAQQKAWSASSACDLCGEPLEGSLAHGEYEYHAKRKSEELALRLGAVRTEQANGQRYSYLLCGVCVRVVAWAFHAREVANAGA